MNIYVMCLTSLSTFVAGNARHYRHDARGYKAEQGANDPSTPERGLAMLEGQYPLEGARPAHPHREHDTAIRQGQGGLVDKHRTLQ